MNRFVKSINRVSLIQQIIIGLIIGILTALYVPDVANELALLGVLFVGALKGIAPILVFFLVIAAISKHRSGQKTGMGLCYNLIFTRYIPICGFSSNRKLLFPYYITPSSRCRRCRTTTRYRRGYDNITKKM